MMKDDSRPSLCIGDLQNLLLLMLCYDVFCSCLDNTLIQCSHGKVPFSKITSMKRLSSNAWHKLLSKVCFFPFKFDALYCAI